MKFFVATPQFTRPKNWPAPSAPPEDWAALLDMDAQALLELGLCRWGCREDCGAKSCTHGKLWVYPGEWYPKIPNGLEVVNIFFESRRFALGVTDDDTRYGCLSFGFMGPP